MDIDNLNWHVNFDENIYWLGFDRHDSQQNSLNYDSLKELNKIIDSIDLSNVKAIVIYSKKPKGFVGADISQIKNMNVAELSKFIQYGGNLFDKIEKLTVKTIFLINGFCLGGGFELALACDYRVASNDYNTKVGLPEVRLGIHPGWGGCIRLTRLIGISNSIKIILAGRFIDSNKAKKLGIITDVAQEYMLDKAAVYYANNKIRKKINISLFVEKYILYIGIVRKMLRVMLQNDLENKVRKNHYPSPYAILDIFFKKNIYSNSSFQIEQSSLQRIVSNQESLQNMLLIYNLGQRKVSVEKSNNRKITRIHVIGSGVMGTGIASWCAYKGFKVSFEDINLSSLGKAIKISNEFFAKKISNKYRRLAIHDNLIMDPLSSGINTADLVIEAVKEDIKIKKAIFCEIEKKVKPGAILATNTSSIDLEEIHSVMQNPHNLLGIHFFNPVDKMKLVEIIYNSNVHKDLLSASQSFVKNISKIPLFVKSSPGFLVNRILMPYLIESISLLKSGVSKIKIDSALISFGFPMGPIQLIDLVGIDVCVDVLKNISSLYESSIPDILRDKIHSNHLGVKSGRGFYKYKNIKIVGKKPSNKKDDIMIVNKMIIVLLKESYLILQDKIVENEDEIDTGLVYGIGFPAYTGGLINYCRKIGAEKINKISVDSNPIIHKNVEIKEVIKFFNII